MDGTNFVLRLLHSFAFQYAHRKISAFLVFLLVFKHYVMLQFQLSRLCRVEIALQSAPSCSSWATSEKALIFVHSQLCTVLSWLYVVFLPMNWFLGPALLEQGGDVWAHLCFAILRNFLFCTEKIMKAWILCLSETNSLILNFQDIFPLILQFWIAAKVVHQFQILRSNKQF